MENSFITKSLNFTDVLKLLFLFFSGFSIAINHSFYSTINFDIYNFIGIDEYFTQLFNFKFATLFLVFMTIFTIIEIEDLKILKMRQSVPLRSISYIIIISFSIFYYKIDPFFLVFAIPIIINKILLYIAVKNIAFEKIFSSIKYKVAISFLYCLIFGYTFGSNYIKNALKSEIVYCLEFDNGNFIETNNNLKFINYTKSHVILYSKNEQKIILMDKTKLHSIQKINY